VSEAFDHQEDPGTRLPEPVSRRRPKGDGSIYSDKRTGKWRGYVELPSSDGSRTRKYFTARTRSEVAKKVREAKQRVDQHLPIPDARITVNEVIDRFLAEGLREELCLKTIDSHTTALNQARKRFGGVRVVSLSPAQVAAACRDMRKEGLSKSYTARMRNLMCQVLRFAEGEGIVARNAAELSPRVSFKAETRNRLTPEQAVAFVDECVQEKLGDALIVEAALGLRPGELTGLSWPQIDLEAETVAINQSLKHQRTEPGGKQVLHVGGLKPTPNADRVLRLPSAAVNALRRQKARQEVLALRPASLYRNDSDLCFTTDRGTPIDPANLRRVVRRVKARAGIEVDVKPYDFRHLHQSILHDADVPATKVADVAGNDAVTSLRDYRFRVQPIIEDGVAPINDLFGDR
jgi:integrase